jgi:hypothetical protein
MVASNAITNPIKITTSVILSAAKNQQFAITFTNVKLSSTDIGLLDSEISIYPLSSPTTPASQVCVRGTALTKGSPVVTYSGGATTVTYTLDLSGLSISNLLEAVILGNNFSVNGVQVLNLDGDSTPGEAGDDDFVGYIIVTGAPVTVTGLPRFPRYLNFSPTPTNLATTGVTAITFPGFLDQDGTTVVGTASSLSSVITIQKYNTSSQAWGAAGVGSPALSAGGVFTINLSTATAAGDTYRILYGNLSSIASGTAFGGYTHRLSYNNKQTSSVSSTYLVGGSYNTSSENTSYTATSNVAFDANGLNGIVTVSLSGLGSLGISTGTVTAANFKIMKISTLTTVSDTYYPYSNSTGWGAGVTTVTNTGGAVVNQSVSSVSYNTSTATSPIVYLYLPAAQKQDTGSTTTSITNWHYDNNGNTTGRDYIVTTVVSGSYYVAIGPGAIDLGSGSGSLNLGDVSNLNTNIPYLFRIITSTGTL